ncbi:ERF family protein [Phocaeicola vulgatus]|jgi:erf family protein
MKELNTIQNLLKAPKNQYNKFGNYKYRNCEDILEAVKPLLFSQSCTLTISDEIVMIGTRYYVRATATIKNANGETETTTAYAREDESKKGMDASQITGSTSSYARKYALNGLFCIDDTKDSDSLNNECQSNNQLEKDNRKLLPKEKFNDEDLMKWIYQKLEKAKSENKRLSLSNLIEKYYKVTQNDITVISDNFYQYKVNNNLP